MEVFCFALSFVNFGNRQSANPLTMRPKTTQYWCRDVQKMIKVIYTMFLGNIGQAERTNSRFGPSGSPNVFPGHAAAWRCTTRWMLFIFASSYMQPTRHCQWIVELLKYYRRGAMTLTVVQECFGFWYVFVAGCSFSTALWYITCCTQVIIIIQIPPGIFQKNECFVKLFSFCCNAVYLIIA